MTSVRPMRTGLIQAALDGGRLKSEHDAIPQTIDEFICEAISSVAAGAGAIHLHPRDPTGRESLDPTIIDETVVRVRAACGVPVGVTTGDWIEPDLDRRLAMIRAWNAPDFASVNLSEPGSIAVMHAMIETGIGIEAGVWTVEDAEFLAHSGLGEQVTRILVEPGELQVGNDQVAALVLVDDIHQTLDRHGLTAPRLQHGDGRVTWTILADAFRRGLDTRVGFEDTLVDPNGERATGNAALVRAAFDLRVG